MMHPSNQSARLARLFSLAALVFLLAACGGATPTATESPLATPAGETATIHPTSEPTAAVVRVILVSDSGATPAEVQNTESRLSALAAQESMTLTKAESLTAADLTTDVRIVVWQGTASGISELAAGAPQVQFVAITSSELEPAANLNVIRLHPENAIFIAGYISTLIAPDWRGAGLLPADGPLGDRAQAVFTNGGRFFCGRCAPAYAPVVLFPVSAMLPGGSPASSWQAAFDELNANVVEVLYVSDAAASPELYEALSALGLTLIGSQPPTEDLRSHWAATVQVDGSASLETLWPGLLAGQPGQALDAPVTLSDVDPDKFSPGRQDLVDAMIADLQNGLVDPFSIPVE